MALKPNKPIKIPYKPRKWAKKLHNALVRWIVLVLHRRAGKTTAAFNHLQRDAMRYKNTRYAYIAPTFKQAKRIVWAMAKQYASTIPGVKFNSSELLITYPNGSEIMILGSDSPDSLRGIALWGVFLDEYPLQSPIVFTEIVTKCLADHQGYCIFGGTPKGKGHFYKVFKVANQNPETWCLVYKTIDESLNEESGRVIENLRLSLADDKKLVEDGLMTEDEFMQEWYNSFEAAAKGAVYLKELAEARQAGRVRDVPYDPRYPVYTIWDLGIGKSDAMAIGFYQRVANWVYCIDYYENTGLGMKHYIKVVKDKPYVYGKHFAPHDIRHKELISGKSRLEGAKLLGIDFEITPSVGLEDGIDLARAMLHRTYFDKVKCELLLDFLGQYHYEPNEKKGILGRTPVHDFTSHAADHLRYAAVCEEYMTYDDIAPTPNSPQPDGDDEYVGGLDYEDQDQGVGMGRHPMMKGVNIGAMGHKPTKPIE